MEQASGLNRITPISLSAAVCVIVLAIVIVSGIRHNDGTAPTVLAGAVEKESGNAGVTLNAQVMGSSYGTSTSEDLSTIGPTLVAALASQYESLRAQGLYTSAVGEALAAQLAPTLKAPLFYKTFSSSDIKTTSDTSFARMQTYQKDIRAALAPLSKNTTPEIAIFSQYVQTNDARYLDEVRRVAGYYKEAVLRAALVTAPQDASDEHVAILNAMQAFSAVLEALAEYAHDPIAVMALLQTYNDAERDMVVSFNSFASYIGGHTKP